MEYNTYAMFDGSLRMKFYSTDSNTDGVILDDALEVLKDQRITTLELSSNYCKDWKPILDVYDGRGDLAIYTKNFNFKLLEGYNNLEKLNIEVPSMKQGFDLLELKSLKYLNIRAGKSIEKINFESQSLSALRLSYYCCENLELIKRLKTVQFLNIYRSAKLLSLEGVDGMFNLKNIWLQNNSKLNCIKEINKLGNLVNLKMTDNKRLIHYSPISKIKNLKRLMIIGSTDSIGFISNCIKLDQLSFQMKIDDGDLSPIKKLTKLSYLDGREYKGQSPSFNEITSHLIEKFGYAEVHKNIPDFDAYIK